METPKIPELTELPKLPEHVKTQKEEFDKLVKNTEKNIKTLKEKLLKKYEKNLVGIALLPPQKEAKDKNEYEVMILYDPQEKKKPNYELHKQIIDYSVKTAEEIDKNMKPLVVALPQLWQDCYDQKYELLYLISSGHHAYDKGMLGAIRLAQVHKEMVIKKFEKYIVSYCLVGSLVQGRATKDSDIDVFIVVDDTDVKKMTRFELRDKLRAIIIGMGMDAGALTGIKNKLNIQVYILTDFWDSVKEANPVIFTFLRDGIPFFDRGIFMPWKLLLKMGKIRPSQEAIDMYMSSGEQGIDRVRGKLKDIGAEEFFWAILTPSQAALMLYGVPPPAPKETPDVLREIFVQKENMLEEKYVKILENVIKLRKDIEYGIKKEVSGKEIDQMVDDCKKYLERIRELFSQIQKTKDKESIIEVYDAVTNALRDVIKLEGYGEVPTAEIVHTFSEKLTAKGKIPAKYIDHIHAVMKAKEDYDANKLTHTEITMARKKARELLKYLTDYIENKRLRDLEKTRIRVLLKDKMGEVLLLGETAYILEDITQPEVKKAKLNKDGKLGPAEKADIAELEKAVAKANIPAKMLIQTETIKSIEQIFGKEAKIVLA